MDLDRPRRILHVSPSFHPAYRYGGPVATLYALCQAQRTAGLDVQVLTSDADGWQRLSGLSGRTVYDYGVPTFYGRVKIGEDIAPELVPALREKLLWADLVHVTGLWSVTSLLGLGGANGFISRRRPCVVSPRGALLPWALRHHAGRKKLALLLLAPLLRQVAGWHATSDEEAEALQALQRRGIISPRAAIAVVANGISVEKLSPPPASQPRIVVLGRVHPIKNLELALDALSLLRTTHPEASLRIIGPEDPGYRQTLREKVRALNLNMAVSFVGPLVGESKLEALRTASLLWLCSHMESFGNVALESLAAGTPVIAAQTTPWSKLPAMHAGLWVAPTAADFAQASASVLAEQQNDDARAAVFHRCRAAVSTRYAWPVVEAQLRELYQRAWNGTE